MEASFNSSPLVEPIGRKPFLKKWVEQKPAGDKQEIKRNSREFEDTYRFWLQILEHENLELAYKFRYTAEAAGREAFIKQHDRLDRALKRAKNKAYDPLERLLNDIQLKRWSHIE